MNFSVCPFSPAGSEEPNESILLNNLEKKTSCSNQNEEIEMI